MYRVLTEEESRRHDEEIQNWWMSLDKNLQSYIHRTFNKVFEQMYCVHDFETNDNIDFEYCKKCTLHRGKE